MLCEDIKKELKPFLEDMLTEATYQEFLQHVEGCTKCKEYVTSVDSFSNQLWKLGEVDVPSDFGDTVIFKLSKPEEPEEEEEVPEMSTSKKILIGLSVVVLTAIMVVFVIFFLKVRESSEEDITIARAPAITEEAGQTLLDRASDPDSDYDESESASQEDDSDIQIFFSDDDFAADEEAPPAKTQLLHWHFLNYDKTLEAEISRLQRESRSVASKIRRATRKLEQAQTDSPDRVQEQESALAKLKERQSQVEAKLDQSLKKRGKRDGEPLKTFKSKNIPMDYKDNDFLQFSAMGEDIQDVLAQIETISPDAPPLKNFTPRGINVVNNVYQVSVYTVKKDSTVLHWHVSLARANQRALLMTMIQENGGIVNYETEEELTFSILSSRIDDLKGRLPAMRINLTEFGEGIGGAGGLDDETVGDQVISIYFSK